MGAFSGNIFFVFFGKDSEYFIKKSLIPKKDKVSI